MKQSRNIGIIMVVIVALFVIISVGIVHAITQLNTSPLSQLKHATAVPTPTTIIATKTIAGLAITGNHVVNAQGQTITLVGASRDSLEYLCGGDGHFTLADFQAMRAWGMNVVRIPLSSEFWATCPEYHLTVTSDIANAKAAGLYVILDLQWNAPFDTAQDRQLGGEQCPLPDTQKDVRFWQDLATIYHTDQSILFDIYGEPHDISWSLWLHGGYVPTGCYQIKSGGSVLQSGGYMATGMQTMVTTIRAIAPKNIIIVSGIDWGYDLSGIQQGFSISGGNILYGTHPFNYGTKQPKDWPRAFGILAQQDAVIATEFGSYDCGTSYSTAAIAYFNRQHMSWLAWSWNIAGCGGPSLLSTWSGTASVPYGAYIRTQMQAVAKTNP